MTGTKERQGTRRVLCHYTWDGKPLMGPVGSTDHMSCWVDVPWPDTEPPDDSDQAFLKARARFLAQAPGGALARVWWALAYRLGWRPLR